MVKPAQPNLPTPDEMLSAEFHSDDLEACWLPKYSPAELRKAQLADPSLRKLLTWIEADGSPTVAELYLCPPEEILACQKTPHAAKMVFCTTNGRQLFHNTYSWCQSHCKRKYWLAAMIVQPWAIGVKRTL